MTRHGILLPFLALLAIPTSVQAQGFGGSLAIAGGDVLIGETGNSIFPGIVYVYQGAGGVWREVAQFTAADNEGPPDHFGRALAAEGTTLLVGSPGRAEGIGAVYVFRQNGSGSWTEVERIIPADGAEGDAFGSAIAIRGDVAVVSAPGREAQTGAVYLLRRGADGRWSEHSQLVADGLKEGSAFGTKLALDGETILVGVPSQREAPGAVYTFGYDAGADAWTQGAMLETSALGNASGLASALGLRDGLALVGAPQVAGRQGVVLAFAHDAETGAWVPQGRLAPFAGGNNAQFGTSIAFDGATAWIGAPGEAQGRGALYAFERDEAGEWSGATRTTGADLPERASFGNAMVVQGGVAVVGATGVDSREGAAVLMELAGGGWQQRNTVINEMKGFDAMVGADIECTDDRAAGFECSMVDVASFLPIKDIGGSRGVRVNDIWGWTDPETGREYAMVGRTDGTSFIDVSDPNAPTYLGDLPKTEGSRSSIWRDIKVYRDHAYIVADAAGEHGVQVFDLTELRNVRNAPVTFEATMTYHGIHSAHNIVINEETGFAYAVGSSGGGETCGGGLHMIDIRNPESPSFAGCFADPSTGRRGTGYSHDAQCVEYHGPDTEHQGKEICMGANETALSIADVTDKNNPVALATASYPNVAYTHQGWLTDDHRYFYMNDEGDEPQGLVDGTRTLVWDVTDLDDPILVKEYIAETTTTDHNLYVRGNMMYQSNYGSGLRILDVSDPENPVEVGFFDTTPYGGGGSWSNYPFFESGVIVVTSMSEGLFVLKSRGPIRLVQ
ncbi:MAG: choice-of-anchor B family protein [Gemmatimonadetes bacterium]|nr:choice-of-anchor B family protein [Gemmatimonadota bacterium]